jgi:dienelactone hydrolase
LGSFREILAGEGESKPVTILGTLKMPKRVIGKIPAVVILHGVGGVNDHYFEVANILNEMGVAAFIVDSFRPRGVHGIELAKSAFHSYAIRISDAYASLELLSTHPKIDRTKIAVLGFSHGGAVALFVASEKIRHSFIADDLRFAASIAYYPTCGTQLENIDFTAAPVLMLLAEKDNMAPVEGCLVYAQRMKESGVDIETVVYKGAHHQFPVIPGDELIKVSNIPDWSNCGIEYLILLRDDGTCFFPHTNKTVDEANGIDGDYTADCRIDGGAIVGGNEEAKLESIEKYKNLLRKVFNLQ